VISVEARTTSRYLHAQGMGLRAIAARLGLARNTVRAAIRAPDPPVRTRAKRPNPHLAPFAAQSAAMLFERRYIGSRILREPATRGYRGGPPALYAYLAQLKAERALPRGVERFEAGPGEQAQFDRSPHQVPLGEASRRVVLFGLILGYSRRKYYLASLDETQASAFAALGQGFAHFGGGAKRLLVDNAKVLVAEARPATFAWNPHFLELCGHHQIEPVACQVRRPQAKGKIERPFFYALLLYRGALHQGWPLRRPGRAESAARALPGRGAGSAGARHGAGPPARPLRRRTAVPDPAARRPLHHPPGRGAGRQPRLSRQPRRQSLQRAAAICRAPGLGAPGARDAAGDLRPAGGAYRRAPPDDGQRGPGHPAGALRRPAPAHPADQGHRQRGVPRPLPRPAALP
jgi:transposase